MPLHPRAKAFIDQLTIHAAEMETCLSIEDQRRASNLMVEKWGGWGPNVAKIEDQMISDSVSQVPIRVYTPEGIGPFPVLVYFHGGGFYMGGIATVDSECRLLSNTAGCMVVSVEYRLAPEHKFPAAIEDGYATTRWVHENAGAMNADAARIAVGGSSSGGNLAAVVALMARDQGAPPLIYQLLMYPVTNFAFDTPSYRENVEGYMLTKDTMIWCWSLYLRTESDGDNPYASPLRAQNFHDLPSALIVTAEYDPLRDEGEAYANRLAEVGVSVICKRYEGWIHGGQPVADLGIQALQEAGTFLRAVFFQ